MSILKRSKQIATFRSPVGLSEIDSVDNSVENQEDQSELRKKLIDEMAQEVLDGQFNEKDPLDKVKKGVNVAVSPRTKAEWQFIARQEGRNMSAFIRRAVDFYIRKHGLDK
jgi:hypothetical protein